MENRESIEQLFGKFLRNKCTPQEIGLLLHYFGLEENEVLLRDRIVSELETNATPDTKHERTLDEVHQSLLAEIRKDRGRTMRLPGFLRYAAIWLVALASIEATFYFFQHKKEQGVTAMVHLVAGPGERREVKLPDGSIIWLNAGSSLHYPKVFEDHERKVVLRGEAFFTVARNPEKPFVIRTDRLQTKVLGTRFNVRAYPEDSSVAVAVVSGKVEVRSDVSSSAIQLTKDEQAIYHKSEDKLVRSENIDAAALSDWHTGKLHFRGQNFAEVARILERRFDTKIAFDEALGRCSVHADFTDSQPVSAILKMLAISMNGTLEDQKDAGYRMSGAGCP